MKVKHVLYIMDCGECIEGYRTELKTGSIVRIQYQTLISPLLVALSKPAQQWIVILYCFSRFRHKCDFKFLFESHDSHKHLRLGIVVRVVAVLMKSAIWNFRWRSKATRIIGKIRSSCVWRRLPTSLTWKPKSVTIAKERYDHDDL